MSRLSSEECNLMMSLWKVCALCETSIKEEGSLYDCQCFHHQNDQCPVPRVENFHHCSLQVKQKIIASFVRKEFGSVDERQIYRECIQKQVPQLVKESLQGASRPLDNEAALDSSDPIMYESLPLQNEIRRTHGNRHISAWQVAALGKFDLYRKIVLPIRKKLKGNKKLKEKQQEKEATSIDSGRTFSQMDISDSDTDFEDIDELDDSSESQKTHSTPSSSCAYYRSDLTLIEILGAGGQGISELVSVGKEKKFVAKQFSSRVVAFSDQQVRQTIKELEGLKHTNLVTICGALFESKIENRYPIGYIMEYMPGGNLLDVIHGRLNCARIEYGLSQIFEWTRQAAAGLIYLHKNEIVHRDLKPQSLLLSGDLRTLKVSGWNSFRSLRAHTVETIPYVAPELLTNKRTSFSSKACDVYSLAICVWEIYYRVSPFLHHSRNTISLMEHICNGGRPEFSNDCDPELQTLLKSSVMSEVAFRPSMQDFHDFTVRRLKLSY